MPDKVAVSADVYVEDSPGNIEKLQQADADVIIFENSTNRDVAGARAKDWTEAETLIRERLERLGPRPTTPTREQLVDHPPEA